MDLDTPLRSLLASLDLDLYDVEMVSGTLNVIVSKAGGVDLESLTKANRTIGEWLDLNDPFPGHYTLDVSSPGLERKLRTSHHFTSAIGELVTLRERRGNEPTRRLEGVVLSVEGNAVTIAEHELGTVSVNIDDIERARTVFVWGPEPKASKPTKAPAKKKNSSPSKKKG